MSLENPTREVHNGYTYLKYQYQGKDYAYQPDSKSLYYFDKEKDQYVFLQVQRQKGRIISCSNSREFPVRDRISHGCG